MYIENPMLGQPSSSASCSGWEQDLQSFSKVVAEHYLKTEMGLSLKAQRIWCSGDGKRCEVYFSCKDPSYESCKFTVAVSFVNVPSHVIARKTSPLGPRLEYNYRCTPEGKLVLSFRKRDKSASRRSKRQSIGAGRINMGWGLGNLSQPMPSLRDDQKKMQTILADVLVQLQRRFTRPDDPKLIERRRTLRNLLNAAPPSQARKLHDRLRLRRRDDELSRLFHDRLATATRNEMLAILANLVRTHEERLGRAILAALRSFSLAKKEPYLIDALLVSDAQLLDQVGVNIAQNEFSPQLAEQLFEFEHAALLYSAIGELLRLDAEDLQRADAAFRDRVEKELQRRQRPPNIPPRPPTIPSRGTSRPAPT
jgi:hypothetical protein